MERAAGRWRTILFWAVLLGGILWVLSGNLSLLEESSTFELESFSAANTFAGRYELDPADPPTVSIVSDVGNVTLQGDSEPGMVRHEVTTIAFAASESKAADEVKDMIIGITHDDTTIEFNTVQKMPEGERTNRVDLTLAVPSTTQLAVHMGVGELRVERVTVPAPFSLRTLKGSIVVDTLTAPAGMVIRADAGSVTFSGEIGPTGEYELTASIGDLVVRIPASTNVRIDAHTSIGTITIDGLELDDQVHEQVGGSSTLTGILGDGGPVLILRNLMGNIHIEGY